MGTNKVVQNILAQLHSEMRQNAPCSYPVKNTKRQFVRRGFIHHFRAPLAPPNPTRWRGCALEIRLKRLRILRWRPPQPEVPTMNFCLDPGLERKFSLRRARSSQKLLPCNLEDIALLTKGKQVSLVRTHFPHRIGIMKDLKRIKNTRPLVDRPREFTWTLLPAKCSNARHCRWLVVC